jgi:hypothetical protein
MALPYPASPIPSGHRCHFLFSSPSHLSRFPSGLAPSFLSSERGVSQHHQQGNSVLVDRCEFEGTSQPREIWIRYCEPQCFGAPACVWSSRPRGGVGTEAAVTMEIEDYEGEELYGEAEGDLASSRASSQSRLHRRQPWKTGSSITGQATVSRVTAPAAETQLRESK